jgi:hypothetical protein
MDTEKLKQEINAISEYVKKPTIKYLTYNLNEIKKSTDDKGSKNIDRFTNIISKAKLNANDRKEIRQLHTPIFKSINKFEEEYNNDSNSDESDEELNDDEIEQLIDDKIHKYNKYTEENPMHGVSWNKSKETYTVKYDDIDTTCKDITKACNKVKTQVNHNFKEKILKKMTKLTFYYKKHHFVSYWHNNNPYFDIQHIISVLNLKKSYIKEKYNNYSDNILFYILHENKFGGYITRELIDEKTMFKIILSSSSSFSKSFKDDVAQILVDLRKQGDLVIDKKEFKLATKNKRMNPEHDDDLNLMKVAANQPFYSYDSIIDKEHISELIHNGARITLGKYLQKYVLYMFIVPLRADHDYVIVKIGYTCNIADRIITLTKEYSSNVYLINLKLINTHDDETTFHNILKTKYPHTIQEYAIDTKNKTKNKVELYKLSRDILNEYNEFNVVDDSDDDSTDEFEFDEEEQKIFKSLQNQGNRFISSIERNNNDDKSYNLLMKNKDIQLLTLKHKFDLELSTLKYKYIDKEIKLESIQLERDKLRNDNFAFNNSTKNSSKKNKPIIL